MSHVSDDVLAAIALGDPDVDPADREHAESCPVCSEELAELDHVHTLLREEVGLRASHRVDPGPEVWQRVLAATRADADMDPPTGIPRKSPATTLPTPCPTKSREASEARPSGLGMPADTAAPWTSPMKASDAAGTRR